MLRNLGPETVPRLACTEQRDGSGPNSADGRLFITPACTITAKRLFLPTFYLRPSGRLQVMGTKSVVIYGQLLFPRHLTPVPLLDGILSTSQTG